MAEVNKTITPDTSWTETLEDDRKTILSIRNLQVSFHIYSGEVHAVRGVNLDVRQGETLAIVGESGCGKSVTVQSIQQLHDRRIIDYKPGSEILYNGKNLLTLSEKEMDKIRGKEISMIFQDTMKSLNPTMTVGKQIVEMLRHHDDGTVANGRSYREVAIEALKSVGIPNAEKRFDQYPHEFSGGMRQRAMIAIATVCRPKVLIADEPTTALDVTVQAQILELMQQLQQEYGMSIIFITHNLGVVANIAQRVAVMYGGEVVESGTVGDIFYRPHHPYTWGLMNSTVKLDQKRTVALKSIEGTPPDLIAPPKGCPFADRCEYCMQVCRDYPPEIYGIDGDGGHVCRCWLQDPDCPVKVRRPLGNG